MSVTVYQMDRQCKIAAHLSLPQLETILPPSVIQEVRTSCQA
jgi:hypothetical protein